VSGQSDELSATSGLSITTFTHGRSVRAALNSMNFTWKIANTKQGKIGLLASVFNLDADHATIRAQVDDDAFLSLPSMSSVFWRQLEIEGIAIFEIGNIHDEELAISIFNPAKK
jgi:hypothetical protein